ncbi:MAG: hypothetical protein AB4038_11670, partial [Prochloraceae cyanobacterium]
TKSILKCLQRLANGETLEETDFQEFIDKLVKQGQREIINTDLENVITDAIEQQLEWNQQKIKSNAGKPQYNPGEGYFDKLVTPLMAENLAQDSLTNLSLEEFFSQEYRVGSEKLLEDVPANILQRLGAKASLNLRNILVFWQGDKITNNLLYTIVNSFLLAFSNLVNFEGLSLPRVKTILTIILTIILIVSLIVIVKNSLLWVILALVTLLVLFLSQTFLK